MSFFHRWYIQDPIKKINSEQAMKLLKDIDNDWPEALTDEQKEEIIDDAGEIYHCNAKLPLGRFKKLLGLAEDSNVTKANYASVFNQQENPDIFTDFIRYLGDTIMFDFKEHEQDKIKKVGQYLRNDESLELPALKRALQPNEGLNLAMQIAKTSQYVYTGKLYIETGGKITSDQQPSLVCVQALLFIPERLVSGTPEAEDGVTPLSLNEIRLIACSPKKSKKRKQKTDDPGAESGNEKGYKTRQDKRNKELTAQQKITIAEQVRSRILQVSDSSFLNALANCDKIKTTRDAFDFCLNVIPLREMLQIALECAKKYINQSPEDIVCKTIMDNLEHEDVQNILKYVGRNATTDSVAASFRTYIIGEFDKVTNSTLEADPTRFSAPFRDFLVQQYQTSVTDRQIICSMIFLAVPAAIVLLGLYIEQDITKLNEDGTCADPLSPAAAAVKGALENPVKDALIYIKDTLYSHPVLGHATNLVDNLIDQVILFIDEIVTLSVATILQELAYLCEDSSKSDLANVLNSSSAHDSNIDDILTSRQAYDDAGNYIDEKDVDDIIDGCEELFESSDLIEDFFNDIPGVLTHSEVCILFNGDPESLNYKIALDKIYYGLMAINKYECLAKVFDSKNEFADWLNIFGQYIDEIKCQKRVEDHTKSKKLLSELCKSSDDGFIDDLEEKAGEDLIDDILNREEDLLNELLNAIKKLAASPIPEVFCGPEAENSGKTPLLPSFQEDSQLHIGGQYLQSIFTAAEKLFEAEIGNFKAILTSAVDISQPLDNFFNAANEITSAMNALYELDLEDKAGNLLPSDQTAMTETLNNITTANKIVAPRVKENLIGLQSNLHVTSFSPNVFQIKALIGDYGQIFYILNYQYDDFIIPGDVQDSLGGDSTVPGRSSKLIFVTNAALEEPGTGAAVYESVLPQSASPLLPSSIFVGGQAIFFNAVNTDDSSPYLNKIKDSIYSSSFFANIIEQIIREHAEFISANDLFKKTAFNELKLSKNNFCGDSLFNCSDIVDKLNARAKKVECYTGIGKIPTPSEKVLIGSVYEAMVRTVVAAEMLKSFFVFASFGLEAILPSAEDDDETLNSFYYDFISEQVAVKVDDLIPEDKTELVETAVEQVVAADKGSNSSDEQFSVIRRQLIQDSISSLQGAMKKKLDDAGFKTNIYAQSLDSELTEGVLATEFDIATRLKSAGNVLSFVVNNIQSVQGAGIVPLPPPTVKNLISTSGAAIGGPNGGATAIEIEPLYSTNPRLKNGGFFIEEGLEIIHNRQGTESPVRGRVNAITSDEIDQLLRALPNRAYGNPAGKSMFELAEYEGFNAGAGFPDTTSDNLLTYLGRKITTDTAENSPGKILASEAQSLGSDALIVEIMQRFLFGGQRFTSATAGDNGHTSTFFSSDYPFGYDFKGGSDGIPLDAMVEFLNSSGRLPLGSGKTFQSFYSAEGTFTTAGLASQGIKSAIHYFAKNLRAGLEKANEVGGGFVDSKTVLNSLYGFGGIGDQTETPQTLKPGENPFYDTEEEAEAYWGEKGYKFEEIDAILAGAFIPEGYEQYAPGSTTFVSDISAQLNFLDARMRSYDTYFYKFGSYQTLNILIRAEAFGLSNDIDQLLNNMSGGNNDESSFSSFANVALEKKFLIKDNGIFYFKLPIAYVYKPFSDGTTVQGSDPLPLEDITPPSVLSAIVDGTNTANLDQFVSSFQYDSILSFVSIFVTSTLKNEYPALESLFDKTLLALQSALLNQLAMCDRENNQKYYENDFNKQQLIQFQQPDMSLLALLLEAVIKAVANITDPTWRTPWFLPGPVTACGILAKILDGSDDIDDPNQAKAVNKGSAKPQTELFDCTDE